MPVRGESKESQGQVVSKNPFKERAIKFIEGVEVGLSDKIQEIKAVRVAEPNQPKMDIAFFVFSGGGKDDEEPNDAENMEAIKKVLFHYHTAKDKADSRVVALQILPKPTTEDPWVLSYQEYDVNA